MQCVCFELTLVSTRVPLGHQDNTPLNCTLNNGTLDNGEYNHCEWGITSRDGWTVYDDSQNFILDANDWWIPRPPPVRSCQGFSNSTDANQAERSVSFPDGVKVNSSYECCEACLGADDCISWVSASTGIAFLLPSSCVNPCVCRCLTLTD